MFDFNILNSPEPLDIFLCTPNEKILYQLNGIDEQSASISLNLNNQFELTFDYFRYINSIDSQLVESNGYHDIVVGMKILVDKIGFFKIKYPPMKYDGNKETKTINAVSVDCELEDKDLVGFKINTGKSDSLEYLVTYDDNETESLINDYTGLPYDYIVFYNTYPEQLRTILNKYSDGTYTNTTSITEIKKFCDLIPRLRRKVVTDNNGNMTITEYVEFTYDSTGEKITSIYLSGFNNRVQQLITFYQKYRNQLSLISLALEKCNCNWSIGTIDESLVNKKFQFDIDGKNIYSFLTDDISSVARCVFSFNLFQKKIDIVLADKIGKQSGVVIDKKNLLNSLEISCNSDRIYTRYNVSGGNNIDIKFVNFGSTRIDDLTYFINARNEQGKRIYVSDILAAKYEQFVADRNIARQTYITLTKQYNQALADIDAIKYRVPNDSVQNDWDSFTDAELNAAYTTYNQLLATLQSLYKEDYAKSGGCNSDGSINETYIKKTEYWYDYFAYKNTIEQITETIHARANGSRYADIDNETILKKINAYKTEWSLYGTVELENKITAYNNQLQVLVDGEAIVLKSNSQEAKKWSELNSAEKTEYGNYEGNYQYNTYMKIYNERSACQTYLNSLYIQLSSLETICKTSQESREKLVKLVNVDTYNRTELGKIVSLPSSTVSGTFTNEEIKTINLLYIDKNYSNEYILTTSLDTTVSEVDVQSELLEDAEEQLSIESQPQISFSANIENLLVMPEFKNFDFIIGNFVTLQYYDDYYVDMRITSMSFNPCVPEDAFTVSFSNFIKSKSERTDVSNILGLAVGSSSSSSSSGSGGGSNSFGDDDKIDVTISNTMLSKLLNTEMFGTRVSNIILDTIKVNEITAKYAKFEGLAKGTTIIDGKCITTGYIIDQNYNGTNGNIANTKGSILNLETGYFNFGGGKLKFDGTTLSVEGSITANAGYIGGTSGFVIAANKLYSNGHSAYNTAKDGVYIGTDYIALGNGGVTWFKNDGTGKIGTWNINANAIYRTYSSFGAKNGMYFGTSGLSVSDVFKVDSSGNLTITDKFQVTSGGKLTATDAVITGDITANTLTATKSGKISVWNFNSDAIYRTSDAFGNASGMYFGSTGLSITDKFKVWSNGNFNFGNGKIVYDGTNVTFGSTVTLAWGQVTGADTALSNATSSCYVQSRTLYYASSSSTKPSAPTTEITRTSNNVLNVWSNVCYLSSNFSIKYYYWTCIQSKTKDGSLTCTNVTEYVNSHVATRITEDTVTTSYVNALNVTAGSVAAENITGTTISGKTLSGGSITIGSNFSVDTTGKITAKSGTIGGWNIYESRIESQYGGTRSGMQKHLGDNYSAFYAGCTTSAGGTIIGYSDFYVTHSGKLYTRKIEIDGGSIKIGSDFKVTSTGSMTAKNVNLEEQAKIGVSGAYTTIWHNEVRTDFVKATSGNSALTLESATGSYSVTIGGFVGGTEVKGKFMTPWGYSNTSSGAANCHITSAGTIQKAASSSKRYKNHITYATENDLIKTGLIQGAKSLKPCLFRYNEGYIASEDYDDDISFDDTKYTIGLIAEDVNIALGDIATEFILDKETQTKQIENWHDRPVLVATLALAQNNTKQIEELKQIITKQSELIATLQKGQV